ncbi:MAG: hypothetical protein JWM80_6275 [Cyanobacteria bacterium RYN_339]|nr:hypothetical protein [Cyanobacteria bacterium RYN_339]
MRPTTATALTLLVLAGCTPTPGTPAAGSSAAPTAKPGPGASTAPSAPAASAAPSASATPYHDPYAMPATIGLKVDGAAATVKQTAAWLPAPGLNNTLFWNLGEGAGANDSPYIKGGRMAANEYCLTLLLRQQPEKDFIAHFQDRTFAQLQNALTVNLVKNTGKGLLIWASTNDFKPTAATLKVNAGKVDLQVSIKLPADAKLNDGTSPVVEIDAKGLPIPDQLP